MKKSNNKLLISSSGIFLLFMFLLSISFSVTSCSTIEEDLSKKIKGEWLRSDGDYTIEIIEVMPKGELLANYFNPNPIKVGNSEWKEQDGKFQVYVELRDKNYPGSYYQLTYIEEPETLLGTYYQAVAKQTFEVYFTRNKK